jgi:hypothetical protein
MSASRSPRESEVAGRLHRPLAGGMCGDPPRCIRRVPCSMNAKP